MAFIELSKQTLSQAYKRSQSKAAYYRRYLYMQFNCFNSCLLVVLSDFFDAPKCRNRFVELPIASI